jgi:hypothetical protein
MWSFELAGLALAVPAWLVGLVVVLLSLSLVLKTASGGVLGNYLLPAAVLGLAAGGTAWFWHPGDGTEERRAIEARLSALQSRTHVPGSTLTCLDAAVTGIVEAGCERNLFATPENVAAASAFTAERLEILADGLKFSGKRTPQFDKALEGLRRAIEQDRFGFVANVLAIQEGCGAERCDALVLLRDPGRVQENLERQAFEQIVARHAGAWATPQVVQASNAPPPGQSSSAPPPGRGIPLADKYVLPSSDSIPPVSIMNNEPASEVAPSNASSRDAGNPTPRQAAKPARVGARSKSAPTKPTDIAPLSYTQ